MQYICVHGVVKLKPIAKKQLNFLIKRDKVKIIKPIKIIHPAAYFYNKDPLCKVLQKSQFPLIFNNFF